MTSLPQSHLVEDIHTLWDDRRIQAFVDDIVASFRLECRGSPSAFDAIRGVLVHGMPLNADMFLTFDDVAAHCIGTLMTEGCDVQSPDLGIYAYVGLAIMAVFGQPVGADTISSHIAVITSEAAATDAWLLSQRCAYTADVIRLFRDNGHLDAEEAAALVGSLSDHQM